MTPSADLKKSGFDMTAARQDGWMLYSSPKGDRMKIISLDSAISNGDAQLHVIDAAIGGSRYHMDALRLVNIGDPAEFGRMREMAAAAGKDLSCVPGQSDVWLMLDKAETDHLYRLISQRPDDAVLASIAAKMEILSQSIDHDDAFRSAASDLYASKFSDGDFTIDENAMVSKGDEGAYVMAFLYVRNAEAGFDFDDDELDDEPDDYPGV